MFNFYESKYKFDTIKMVQLFGWLFEVYLPGLILQLEKATQLFCVFYDSIMQNNDIKMFQGFLKKIIMLVGWIK